MIISLPFPPSINSLAEVPLITSFPSVPKIALLSTVNLKLVEAVNSYWSVAVSFILKDEALFGAFPEKLLVRESKCSQSGKDEPSARVAE